MNTAEEFHQMIMVLRGRGLTFREIADECCTSVHIIRHAGKLKRGPSDAAFQAVERLHRRRAPEKPQRHTNTRFVPGAKPRYRFPRPLLSREERTPPSFFR
jgi:hypothetical protein